MLNIAFDDGEFESKHPRDNDGRFTSCANLTGKELGPYKDIKELRAKAVDYYRKNLQGKTVKHPELGTVLFSGKGLKKFTSSSADENKLKMIPAVSKILKHGKYQGEEYISHKRKDGIVKFHRICHVVNMNGKTYTASVLVGEDAAGHKFYNLNPNAESYAKDETPRIPTVRWQVHGVSKNLYQTGPRQSRGPVGDTDSIDNKNLKIKKEHTNKEALGTPTVQGQAPKASNKSSKGHPIQLGSATRDTHSIGNKGSKVKFYFKNKQAMDEFIDRVVRKCKHS